MPLDVLGTGIGILPATRIRRAGGPRFFDAIRAVTILHLPVYSLGASHRTLDHLILLSEVVTPLESSRVVLKAFVMRWGLAFLLIGVALLAMSVGVLQQMGMAPMPMIVIGLGSILLGVVLDITWRVLERHDQRIRSIMGYNGLGISDPVDWPDRTAAECRPELIGSDESLVAVAERAAARGQWNHSMLCARLAMRDPENREARELCDRLLRKAPKARFI